MFENADPIFINIFVVSLTISVLIISWNLTRLLGKTTDALDEFRKTNNRVNSIADRINADYDYISGSVKSISTTVERINEEVLDPIRSIGNIFRAAEAIFRVFRGHVSSETEPEDYLPE